jgi:hypothetical protein
MLLAECCALMPFLRRAADCTVQDLDAEEGPVVAANNGSDIFYQRCTFKNLVTAKNGLLYILPNADSNIMVQDATFSGNTGPELYVPGTKSGSFYADDTKTYKVNTEGGGMAAPKPIDAAAEKLFVDPSKPAYVQLRMVRARACCGACPCARAATVHLGGWYLRACVLADACQHCRQPALSCKHAWSAARGIHCTPCASVLDAHVAYSSRWWCSLSASPRPSSPPPAPQPPPARTSPMSRLPRSWKPR